jgi:uncharacterized OB-fold protein
MNQHSFPRPLMGFYDPPMWESIRAKAMRLQRCRACGSFQYPPAPACVDCLCEDLDWTALSGRGTILSWVIYHRQYLDSYPAPYNVVTVRLEEGPLFTSNLVGPEPEGSWIGAPVRLLYVEFPDGGVLPRFELATAPPC